MSGETGDVTSGWTTDTSRGDLIARIEAVRVEMQVHLTLLDERYATQTKATEKAFDAAQSATAALLAGQERAVSAALAANDKAITKSETAADKRFELLNELRSGVATREQIVGIEKQLGAFASRLDRNEGRGQGLNAGWIYLLAALAAVSTLVSLYVLVRG